MSGMERSGAKNNNDKVAALLNPRNVVILGATAENKPLLEESYLRMLAAFEPHVGMTSYLFVAGRRLPTSPGHMANRRGSSAPSSSSTRNTTW